MKTTFLFVAALGLLLVGCNKEPAPASQTTNSSARGDSVVTAPVDYLNAAVKAEQRAIKTVDVTSLNKAIELFNVQEGRLPKDLNELVAKKYIPLIPTPPAGSKIEYDASAGTVKVVKQ